MTEPTAGELRRIEAALGWRPTAWRRVGGRAADSNTGHWVVSDGERSAFVKVPRADLPADWVRREHRNLAALVGAAFPRVVGWFDDGTWPVLALEDLSGADWVPPWTAAQVAAVLAALGDVSAIVPPAHLERFDPDPIEHWAAIAADPEPFLSVGLCSRRWLDTHLARFVLAAESAPLRGDALVHLDVRSDNLCFRDGRAVLLDWNHATIANPTLDVAFWLPSLAAEGGPAPEEVLPDEPELAAWVAGFFCSYAGLPPIADAPHVRPLQIAQARTALPWAARALGLPPPG
jgi:hypothetical protein